MNSGGVIYTLAQVAENNGKNGNRAWVIIKNTVYDVTDFLNEHPGGADILLDECGKDATKAFNNVGHSSDAKNKMNTYKIGELSMAGNTPSTSNVKPDKAPTNESSNRSCLSIITCGCFD